jgi:cysteine synthase A
LLSKKEGKLNRDSIIAEPSSGNVGIGLTLVRVQKGCEFFISMPENMSEERKEIIRAFGRQIILAPTKDNMLGKIDKLIKLAKADSRVYFPQQFENPKNPHIKIVTQTLNLKIIVPFWDMN